MSQGQTPHQSKFLQLNISLQSFLQGSLVCVDQRTVAGTRGLVLRRRVRPTVGLLNCKDVVLWNICALPNAINTQEECSQPSCLLTVPTNWVVQNDEAKHCSTLATTLRLCRERLRYYPWSKVLIIRHLRRERAT